MALKHGNPSGKGGKREGAGRPLEWFRVACREALSRSKGLEKMEALASFKEFPQLATSEGEVLTLPPPIREFRAAVEWLADRGYGKAEQSLEMTVKDGNERPSREEIEAALSVVRRGASS